MEKKLTRSVTNKMMGGVCGGLADYFDINPTVLRLIYVFLTLFTAGFSPVCCSISLPCLSSLKRESYD